MQVKKVGVISLGCDKNRVDTEKALAFFPSDFVIEGGIENADLVLINTCAFLESSRKEAIEEILGVIALKQTRPELKIIVTGCLPQKFIDEIYNELIEVDAFLGTNDYDKIPLALTEIYNGKRVKFVGEPRGECGKKRVLTTEHYAYLKIADGCSNHCTYCLIPSIRGKFRSVKERDLLQEVKGLKNASEIILVAQDVTRYGEDLTPKTSLVSLIRKLSAVETVKAIRLLYCYPECVTDELIQEIKTNSKVLKYIDIPLQHADDKVLKLMNRRGTGESYLKLIEKLKAEIEGIAIRSTFITGFPQEDQTAFDNLLAFIKSAKLFNAGFFAFSPEEGTPAVKLSGQIDEKVKKQRLKKLYACQKKVVEQNYEKLIGKTVCVLAEGFSQDHLAYYGRAYFNAPDVDGKVYFFSADEVAYGEYYSVKIQDYEGYDLFGERQ